MKTDISNELYRILYDYVSFVFFLAFLLLCILIGKPLYFLDRVFNTRSVDYLIRFFEFFAR